MIRSLIRAGALAATLGLALIGSEAKADFSGSFGFNGLVNTTNTGNLSKDTTTFTSIYYTTNGDATGGFSSITSLPILQPAAFSANPGTPGVTPITLTITPGTISGFSFTNATYGTFTQTAAAVAGASTPLASNSNYNTSVTYYIVGSYTGGPVGTTVAPASVTLTFTQNGGPPNSFSASGTVTIPPAAVPEPASLALVGLGLAGIALARRRMAA